MKLLTEIDVGGHTENTIAKLNLTINNKDYGGSGDSHNFCTNDSWKNLFQTLVLSHKPNTEMPSATTSASHIPSNEDCGIRDVWGHNLEEEFRTIRQVSHFHFIHQTVQHSFLPSDLTTLI